MIKTVVKSEKLYRKVVEVNAVEPDKWEQFFWYGGTHPQGVSINNPYRPKHQYNTRTYYEEVNENDKNSQSSSG